LIQEVKESSTVSEGRKTLQYAALLLIALSWAYEGYQAFALYRFSLLGWGYNILFVILWLWRCAFSYSYTLTPSHFIVVMFGLGMERRMSISLKDMESFSNCYKKSFFRKTKIGTYVHRYSSLDPQPQRILVYRKGRKLCGLLFKCSDRMIQELARRYPQQFLDLNA
jgi:hypothetical protein